MHGGLSLQFGSLEVSMLCGSLETRVQRCSVPDNEFCFSPGCLWNIQAHWKHRPPVQGQLYLRPFPCKRCSSMCGWVYPVLVHCCLLVSIHPLTAFIHIRVMRAADGMGKGR